jgi:hypothetical protein
MLHTPQRHGTASPHAGLGPRRTELAALPAPGSDRAPPPPPTCTTNGRPSPLHQLVLKRSQFSPSRHCLLARAPLPLGAAVDLDHHRIKRHCGRPQAPPLPFSSCSTTSRVGYRRQSLKCPSHRHNHHGSLLVASCLRPQTHPATTSPTTAHVHHHRSLITSLRPPM